MKATRRGFLSFLGGLFGVAAVGVPEVEAAAPTPEPEPKPSPVEPPLTPEDAYNNVLRSGLVEPWAIKSEDFVCPGGGTLTWSFTADVSIWTRSIELPADMEVESMIVAGIPVALLDTPPTQLVADGPASRVEAPLPYMQMPGLWAYKAVPLDAANGVAVARHLCAVGQVVSITCRHRDPQAPGSDFHLILRADALQPYVQQCLVEAQLLAAARSPLGLGG